MKLMLVVLLMFSGYTFASCASISDSDQRAFCNARQSGSSCANISNSELRAECNAEMNGSSCANISDSERRAYCNAK